MRIQTAILFSSLLFSQIPAQAASPFAGRWDFSIKTTNGVGANWLGVTEKDGGLEVWFQPTGGNVYKVKDVKVEGGHMTLGISAAANNRPAVTWELDAAGNQLTGVQKRGDQSMAVTGVRAPELKRGEPKAWSKAEPLFNGKNLDGWEPIGDPTKSHWVVKDGLLVNEDHGANLKSTRKFEDFRLHFEVNCPDDANSGMYLRGRYELQLEYVPAGSEPPERAMGSIYGRIPAAKELPRTPGQW